MSYKSNNIPKNKVKDFKKLKKAAGYLLWEYDVNNITNSFLKRMLIERIMQFGDMKEMRLLLNCFSMDDLAQYFSTSGWKIFSKLDFKFWFEILKDYKNNKNEWKRLYRQRQLMVKRNTFWNY